METLSACKVLWITVQLFPLGIVHRKIVHCRCHLWKGTSQSQLDQTPRSCLYVPRSDLTTRNIISLPHFPPPPPQSHRLRRSVDYLCISCCIFSARALFQSRTQHHSAAQPIAPSRGASHSSPSRQTSPAALLYRIATVAHLTRLSRGHIDLDAERVVGAQSGWRRAT